jgi:hypothetical protein
VQSTSRVGGWRVYQGLQRLRGCGFDNFTTLPSVEAMHFGMPHATPVVLDATCVLARIGELVAARMAQHVIRQRGRQCPQRFYSLDA